MSAFRRHIFYNKLTNGSTILYTTTDGNIAEPYNSSDVVSNVYENGIGIIVFKDKLTTISHRIFNSNSKLKSIVFPEESNTFSGGILWNSYNLEELHFLAPKLSAPIDDFDAIYSGLYYYPGPKLKNIYSSNNSSIDNKCLIINGILYAFAGGGVSGEYTIPNNVTKISRYAMAYNSTITKLNLPNSITHIHNVGIGDNGYEGFLINGIPNSIIYIGTGAFRMSYAYSNSGNITITIPQSCTLLEAQAFMNWNNLKEVHIKSPILEIVNDPFEGCYNITSVYCYNETPPILTAKNKDLFDDANGHILYVPELYKVDYEDSDFYRYGHFTDIKTF